jgi:hypothetical protein
MNHAPADYVNTGFKYEAAQHPDTAKQHAQRLRAMLTSERPEDQAEARRLIEQGRQEARGRR